MTVIPIRLSLRELRHDWQAALCFLAALAGVLGPLLIILALKNGVVGNMVGRLVEDPSNREILAVGAARHDHAFFTSLAARPEVAFVMPATRSISASANGIRHEASRKLERAVPLISSAAGDPLITGAAVSVGNVYVSHALAQKLELSKGSVLDMIIGREIDGHRETARRDLNVIGVLPAENWSRPAVFLALPDLLAVERFRDDVEVTTANWTKTRPEPATYASFRLYAQSLNDIAPLLAHLEAKGVQARPRADNASLLLAFRKNLNLLYIGIAGLAVLGFWAAMSANLRGMVERQRVTFSLLSMLGMRDHHRWLIPLTQSLVLVLTGVACTVLMVLPVLALVNTLFEAAPGEAVAQLYLMDVVGAVGLGVFIAMSAAVWAIAAVNQIEADEVLRHV